MRDIISHVAMALEQDFAQMKLMDLENERLHQKAFSKDQWKAAKKKLASGQARHMTAPEMIDLLARQTWESTMGELFKEASEQFKARRKAIDDYHKGIAAENKVAERARKAAACQAKKAELDAEKARAQAEQVARGHGRGGRGRGSGSGRGRGSGKGRDSGRGCGSGRGRGSSRGQGRGGHDGAGAMAHDFGNSDSEEEVSVSDSTLTDYEDTPAVGIDTTQPENRLPRACRARAPRFLVSEDEDANVTPQVIRPRPKPRPIRKQHVPAPQTVLSAHNSSIQLPEDTTVTSLLP